MTYSYTQCTKSTAQKAHLASTEPTGRPVIIPLSEHPSLIRSKNLTEKNSHKSAVTLGFTQQTPLQSTNKMDFLAPQAVSPPPGRHVSPLSPQHRSPSAIKTNISNGARHISAVTLGNDQPSLHSTSEEYRAYDSRVYAENKFTKQINRLQGTRSSITFAPGQEPNRMTSYSQQNNAWRNNEPHIAEQVSRDAKQNATQFRTWNRASNVKMGYDSDTNARVSTTKQMYDNPWKNISPNSPTRRIDRSSLSPFRRGEADDIKSVLSRSSVSVRSSQESPADAYLSSSRVASQSLTPEARSQVFQDARQSNVQLSKKHQTDVNFGADSSEFRRASYAHLSHPGHVYA